MPFRVQADAANWTKKAAAKEYGVHIVKQFKMEVEISVILRQNMKCKENAKRQMT